MQKHGKAYRAQGWCRISGRLALCGFPSDQEAGKLGKADREGGGKGKVKVNVEKIIPLKEQCMVLA